MRYLVQVAARTLQQGLSRSDHDKRLMLPATFVREAKEGASAFAVLTS